MLTKTDEIRTDSGCFDYNKDQTQITQKDKIVVWYCHGDNGPYQRWTYENGMMRHLNSSQCVELQKDLNHSLVMRNCDSKNKYQQWKWSKPAKKLVN
jgi:hypothetical protein